MSSIQLYVDGVKVYDNGVTMSGAVFAAAVQAAWAADTTLNWSGGDITITSPIILDATINKFNFGLRLNGARISCNFNDATKYALTVQMHSPDGGASYSQGINVRGFQIVEAHFAEVTPYAGAIELKCPTNGSWINSFLLRDITVEAHSDYAFRVTGSVFEWVMDRLTTDGGKGGLYIQQIGTGTGGTTDQGLPSAMYLYSPNFRDFSDDALVLIGVQAFNDPFDITIEDGYIVTGGGKGINAPSGITRVAGVGFENLGNTAGKGGSAMAIGYRGGLFLANRLANAVASSSVSTHVGAAYLVDLAIFGNSAVFEDNIVQAENAGSVPKVANITGSGNIVYLNRQGTTASAIDNPGGCPITNTTP
jgi:hypothetical protein